MPRRRAHGHWKTTTSTASLRHDQIAAPRVLDGPMNGDAFLAYVEQALVPEVRPRDIVIMDKSARPQGPRRQTGDRGRRREPAIPAAFLAFVSPSWQKPRWRVAFHAGSAANA
jgi:hypothetical protein